MRARRLTLTAMSLAVLLPGCGGGDADELTIYSGRDEELVGPLLDEYAEREGVDIRVRYGETPELAATLVEEGDASPADVFFSQDAGALGALQKEGRLGALPEDLLGEVDERYRSVEGDWVGVSGRARIVAYNTEAVAEGDLPESVLDLTADRYEGAVGWAPGNASFQSFVTALRAAEGEDVAADWLEGMVDNGVQVYEDNVSIRDAVASGELDYGLINHYYVEEARAEEGEGYPVGIHEPDGGDTGALVNVAGAGTIAGSDAEEDAQDFIRFLLSRRAQEYFAGETKEYPLAAGVEPEGQLEPLSEIEQPDVDLADLDDLEGTTELLERTGVL